MYPNLYNQDNYIQMVSQKIFEYFKKNLEKGYDLETVKQELIDSGYSSIEVERVSNLFKSGTPASYKQEKKPSGMKFLILLYVLTLISSLVSTFPAAFTYFQMGLPLESAILLPLAFWFASIFVLIAIVYGLLRYARWGFYLAIIYNIAAIIFQIFEFGVNAFMFINTLAGIDTILGINSMISIAFKLVIIFYLLKWSYAFE